MSNDEVKKENINIENNDVQHERGWFTQINTIHFKLMILFVILIFVTTIISLVTVDVVVERYKLAEHPLDAFIQTYAPVRYLDPNFQVEIREKIDQDKTDLENNIFKITIYLLILETIIALGASYIIVDTSLSPLNKLNKTMKEINNLDLRSKIIQDNSSGEVGELIDNFNHMIDKIQTMVEKEKSFVQNISHELKTPISGVKANLESIIILNQKEKDQKTTEAIARAIDSINSLNKLVNDLSILSQLDRKSLPIEKIKVNEEITNIVNQINEQYKKNEIKGEKKLEIKTILTEPEIVIEGAKELFDRAISNLIENAIKYSKDDINITIETEVKENILIITIKDSGLGISKENQKLIFDRFYRIDQSRNRKTGGSGLGLAIVKNIVECFKGNITVESKVNNGSVFTISLPLK